MKESVLKYKNFIGSVHFSSDDDVFFGKIVGIRDLVTFEGTSVSELKQAFKEAVDDYINTCKQKNITPHKSASGTFNIRTSPETHLLALRIVAEKGYKSLNQYLDEALQEKNEKELLEI